VIHYGQNGLFATMSRQAKSDKRAREYEVFNDALKKVLSVSHSQIKSKLNAKKRKRTKKTSASRASNARN